MPFTNSVTAAREIAGASFQIVEHRWDKGAAASMVCPQHMLTWRRHGLKSELVTSLEGEKHACNGQRGELMFVPAGLRASTIAPKSGGCLRTAVFYFDPKDPDYTCLPEHWGERSLYDCLSVNNILIKSLVRHIYMEITRSLQDSSKLLRSLSEALLIELYRHFSSNCLKSPLKSQHGRFSSSEIARITDYIDCCSLGAPTVEEVAKEFGISSCHLSNCFKQSQGTTLQRYIADSRIARAKSMLASGYMSLQEMAYSLGFSEVSAFSNAFYKATGERPGAFRLRHQL